MLTIKENTKPNLPLCEMNCDDILHEKLDKYDLTKFLNKHSTNLLIGKAGSGKTSLMYAFIKSPKLLKKVFQEENLKSLFKINLLTILEF